MKLSLSTIVLASFCGHAAAWVRLQAFAGPNCDESTKLAEKEYTLWQGEDLLLGQFGGDAVGARTWRIDSDNYHGLYTYAVSIVQRPDGPDGQAAPKCNSPQQGLKFYTNGGTWMCLKGLPDGPGLPPGCMARAVYYGRDP